jgi:4-hydroxybenzoate polyprenyltransferase
VNTALAKVLAHLENVKFAHTVFALPFAYMGMILAAGGLPDLRQFLLVTVAMVGARTAAMCANRLIDLELDRRNPRTRARPLVRGLIRPGEVWGLLVAGVMLLVGAAWQLNALALQLAPLALVFLIGYSYTKRFTWLSHWILGVTDGAAAAGGWIAVTGRFELGTWVLWLAVALWVAGFDLLYACQDVEFDRREGLHSVPARFGVAGALVASRLCHVWTVLAWVALGWVEGLHWAYWVGVGIGAALLAYEQHLVNPVDLSRLNVAFFNVNGYIAIELLFFTLVDLMLRR